jgi:hypothetical protein
MFCTRCGNTVKGTRFCTHCGCSLPPSAGFASATTIRKIAELHQAATLFNLPSLPQAESLAASSPTAEFAPTTRRLASVATAEQPANPVTVPVTAAVTLPRKPARRRLLWLCPLLFVVSGFWWGRNPTVLAHLQAFMPRPVPSAPTPAPLASSNVEVPAISLVEAPPAPAIQPPKEAPPESKPSLKSLPPTQPKLRAASKPEPRVQRAQSKPQSQYPLAAKLQAQKKPEAILVLEIKGDSGKRGKKMKELCDKD